MMGVMNSNVHKAMAAYGTAQEQAASVSPEETLARITRAMHANYHKAKAAYLDEKYDIMFNYNKKNMEMLPILMQSLEVPDELREEKDVLGAVFFLSKFYRETFSKTSLILSQKDPVVAFDEIIQEIAKVADRFEQIAGIKPPSNI